MVLAITFGTMQAAGAGLVRLVVDLGTTPLVAEVPGRTWDRLSETGLPADAADVHVLTDEEVVALGGRQIPLCMIGDSITWAEMGDCWRKWILHYVPEVAFIGTHTARLGYSHAGEGGNSTLGVLARVDKPERVPDCPYYHLMIGANDSSAAKCEADVPRVASNTVERIWRVVDRLLAKPTTRLVFLGSILPLRCDNPFRDRAGSAANGLMRAQVTGRYPTNRVVWVEYEKPLRQDLDDWLGKVNFVHPKESGYKTISWMLKSQLAVLVHDSQSTNPDPTCAYGVEVDNLWDGSAGISRPLIPGWYVLSFAAPKAGTYAVRLQNKTDNPKDAFDKLFTVKVAAGVRGEFEFMTGYQGYGYAESPFVIDVSDAAGVAVCVTDVQVEKMRPTRKASCYGTGTFVDTVSPICSGEYLVRHLGK